jgi:phosphoglycolate phosphatase
MKGKMFIFDFDGTIADTSGAVLDIAKRIASESGKGTITEDDVDFFKENGARAFLKRKKISWLELPGMIAKGRKYFSEKKDIGVIDGIRSALIDLKSKDCRLCVVSSNDKGNIISFLKENGMEGVFDEVLCERGIFGKASIIRRLASEGGSVNMFYVGDEVRDGEAARKAGIPFIGVSWGFNSPKSLIGAGAVRIVRKPEELGSI